MSDAAIVGFLAGVAFRHEELSRDARAASEAAPWPRNLRLSNAASEHWRIARDARETLAAMLRIL